MSSMIPIPVLPNMVNTELYTQAPGLLEYTVITPANQPIESFISSRILLVRLTFVFLLRHSRDARRYWG